MSLYSHGCSRPDRWLEPRQPLDPSQRLLTYGRVQPMDPAPANPLWTRLFRWA
jgi:hypothetical protein